VELVRDRRALTRSVAISVAVLAAVTSLVPGAAAQDRTGIERRTGHGPVPVAGAPPSLPPGVVLDDGLSSDDAVAVALWNNAAFHADLATLGLARADLVEAGLLRNPILSLLLPLGPKQLEATLTFPLEVFWQRPRRVAAAKAELDRVAMSLEQNALNLVRDARLAHAEVAFSEERGRLAKENTHLRRQILELVEKRFTAGEIAELEAIAARADVQIAERAELASSAETAVLRERLAFVTGLPPGHPALAVVEPVAEPPAPAPLDALEHDALAARPDLRAAELAIEAAQKRAKWERSRIMTLAGILDINGKGSKGFEAGPGVSAEIPVFNRNQGGKRRADAEVDRAARQFLATRERIFFEVREAYAQLSTARDGLEAVRTRVVPPLQEAVRVAELAYRDGAESYLFVLEASRRLAETRAGELQALVEIRRAEIQLERAVGRTYDAKR